jgi:hypothetical protein
LPGASQTAPGRRKKTGIEECTQYPVDMPRTTVCFLPAISLDTIMKPFSKTKAGNNRLLKDRVA